MKITQFFHGKSGSLVTCILEIVIGVLLLINPVGFTSGIIIGVGGSLSAIRKFLQV